MLTRVARTHSLNMEKRNRAKAKGKKSPAAKKVVPQKVRKEVDRSQRAEGPRQQRTEGRQGQDRAGPAIEPVAQSSRVVQVKAMRLGEYRGTYYKPNDVFTMEVDGDLPHWVVSV